MNSKHTLSSVIIATIFSLGVAERVQGQILPLEVIHYSGSPSEVTNMVILGDGYTLDDQGKFVNDAKKAITEMLSQPPWSDYRESINVYAIKVVSNVAGASRDPDNLIDNYFGSSYWSFDIERLLVAWRSGRVSSVLMSNTPFYDIGVIVVNDDKYGGSGGAFAVFSTNQASAEIMIHELGHSFVNLADEYWAGDQYAREMANMTRNTDSEKIKWREFLNRNGVGIYPHEESPTWHRPHQNCKMRFLGRPFCDVCSHELEGQLQLLSTPPDPDRPIAFFGADRREIMTNEKVNFYDFSSYTPTSWEWTFEGGTPSTSTEKNPEVTYEVAGWYPVALKAKNEMGENEIVRNGLIIVRSPLPDDVPPTIKTKNIQIELDANGQANITPGHVYDGTTDDVALELLELSRTAFDCDDIGENTVVFKAVDASGNEASAEVIVTVLDKILPVAMAMDIEIQLDEDGFASIKPEDVDNGSFDNCGIQSMSLSKTEFGREDNGDNKVIFTVTDQSGNSNKTEITVNVDIILSAESGNNTSGNIRLYPNPANDLVHIEYPRSVDPQLQSLQILDINGRLLNEITEFEKEGKTIPVGVKGLPSGQYFVRLNAGRSLKILRFTIAR